MAAKHSPAPCDDTAPAEQLDGAALLDQLLAALLRYVIFPSKEAADTVVLWIAASYAQTAFDAAPRLNITGPEKRCGKSRLLDMVEATCHEPFVTADSTVAALFRSIGTNPPTLIFDEVDAIFNGKGKAENNEDLRALLNAGFQRNRPARRCVGPLQEVKAFPTFAMAALAGIGQLPDTITDRSVIVRMRRRAPHETVAPYRISRHRAALRQLGNQLGTWVRSQLDQLREACPDLPVEDREADVWEPLIIIADAAASHWPDRARAAALALTREGRGDATEQSLGVRLLADCREVFATGAEEIGSEELCNKLRANPEAPWDGFGFTPRNLATKLKPYGIAPLQVRPGGGPQVRGYRATDFRDAFTRYLPDPDAPPPGSPVSTAAQSTAAQQLTLPTPAGYPSQTVTPSQAQLSPVTLPEPVTDRSVTTADHRGAVTDRSVTANPSVTALTSESDAVTACDGYPAAHGSPECEHCGDPIDNPADTEPGTHLHTWCAAWHQPTNRP